MTPTTALFNVLSCAKINGFQAIFTFLKEMSHTYLFIFVEKRQSG